MDRPMADRVIALEEHFWIPALRDRFEGYHRPRAHQPQAKLDDLGNMRIADMNAAGVDVQVLSHVQPGTQVFDAEAAVPLAREANDRLAEACRARPERFAGFAALPTADPKAAADELERTVTRLNFRGAMVNGLTNGAFLDEKRFWPIFERAEALDVPIYLHPAIPHPAVIDAWFRGYERGDYPILMGAVWGFTAETATAALRLVLSGVFEKHPNLKIILGHMGETIPYSLWRLDQTIGHMTGTRGFADIFRERFWITTSGNFSTPALLCALMELGPERVLFSVDYPYNSSEDGVRWLKAAPISPADRAKIFHGNAERLLKLG
jgi:predicted TIM-barrel fold metal-dependent hydrolase